MPHTDWPPGGGLTRTVGAEKAPQFGTRTSRRSRTASPFFVSSSRPVEERVPQAAVPAPWLWWVRTHEGRVVHSTYREPPR